MAARHGGVPIRDDMSGSNAVQKSLAMPFFSQSP
jgi:hypothetical protein